MARLLQMCNWGPAASLGSQGPIWVPMSVSVHRLGHFLPGRLTEDRNEPALARKSSVNSYLAPIIVNPGYLDIHNFTDCGKLVGGFCLLGMGRGSFGCCEMQHWIRQECLLQGEGRASSSVLLLLQPLVLSRLSPACV